MSTQTQIRDIIPIKCTATACKVSGRRDKLYILNDDTAIFFEDKNPSGMYTSREIQNHGYVKTDNLYYPIFNSASTIIGFKQISNYANMFDENELLIISKYSSCFDKHKLLYILSMIIDTSKHRKLKTLVKGVMNKLTKIPDDATNVLLQELIHKADYEASAECLMG